MVGLTTMITIFGYYNTFNTQLLEHDQNVQQQDETSMAISGMTFGATAGTAGTSSASMYAYVPITITNSQSSATPSTFQQKITFDPASYSAFEASNLGNIRFCLDSGCVTELYAWLESCIPSCTPSATSASVWVKLTSSISASGGTATIYMMFDPSATNFDGNYWGEAPTLSSSYGQYDNGANVFTFYDNFAGTTLNSNKWTVIESSSGVTVSVDNGLTVTTTTDSAYAFVMSPLQTYPLVAETYATSGDSILGVSTSQNLNGFIAPYSGYSFNWYAGTDYFTYEAKSTHPYLDTIAQSTFPAGIWQVTWSAKASQYFSDGAGNTYAGTKNGVAIANYGIYIGQSNDAIATNFFHWARMRAYPPSNVMPSVSFGSLTSSGTSTATSYSFQRHLFYSQGLWWLFYSDGTDIAYRTSPDGATWSSETVVSSSSGSMDGFNFNVWVGGSIVYYVLASPEQSGSSFLWRYGTLQSGGTITWSISETSVSTTNKVDSYDSIVTDSSGNVWVALNTNDGTNAHIEVWKYSGGSWTKEDDISPLASDIVPILVTLANGVALIYGEGSITSPIDVVATTTGASWSAAVSPPSDYALFSSSATAIGSTLYFAGLASSSKSQTSGTVNFWSYAFGATSTSSETVLQSTSSSWLVSISEEPSDSLLVFYGSGTTLSMIYSTDYGGAWSSSTTLSSGESSITGLNSPYTGSGVAWTSGSSSPFNVRFAAVPVIAVTNESPFTVQAISLYIYDTQTLTLVHFDTNSSAPGVSGSFDYYLSPGEELSIPLSSFTWMTSNYYLVTIATDQGVLASSALTSPS